ncbi:replicative DNA helicase [Scytonema sp. NUACC21]
MTSTDDFQFSSIDRLPPQAVDVEEAILGGILFDPNAYERVAPRLKPEMFYITAHKDIYRAFQALVEDGLPTDMLSTINWLSDRNLLDRIGGRNKLATLLDRTVAAINIDALAQLVVEKYIRRELIRAGNRVVELGYQTETDLATVVDRAETAVLDLTGDLFGTHEPEALGSIMPTIFQKIEERHNGATRTGIPCGFYDLDAMLGGFKPGKLYVVAARPGCGKSAFLGNLAVNMAASQDLPSLIFSLEMDKEEWGERLLAGEALIDSGYLQSGKISNTQWEPLGRAIGRLTDMPIYIDDDPYTTFSSVRHKLKRLIAQTQAESRQRFGIVGIDYLGLMADVDQEGSANLAYSIGKVTRALKQLARECQVPIVLLAQLNRGVEGRQNKRPVLSDLRDSGRIEEDADVVLMLYRDELYNPDSTETGIVEVIVTKNRGGAQDTVKLLFDAQFTKFKNLQRSYL